MLLLINQPKPVVLVFHELELLQGPLKVVVHPDAREKIFDRHRGACNLPVDPSRVAALPSGAEFAAYDWQPTLDAEDKLRDGNLCGVVGTEMEWSLFYTYWQRWLTCATYYVWSLARVLLRVCNVVHRYPAGSNELNPITTGKNARCRGRRSTEDSVR